MLSLLVPLIILTAQDANLLSNADFDQGLDGWKNNAPHITFESAVLDDRSVGRIIVPSDVAVSWPYLYQEVAASPNEILEATASATGTEIRDGFGVYISLEFRDSSGERISFSQSAAASADPNKWTDLKIRSVAPLETASARLCLILNGHGQACFDKASVSRAGTVDIKPIDGPVTLTVTDEVVCDSLIGFGAEDDGWFHSAENLEHGVTEEDAALRQARIEWMDPDWQRMFFWYRDWNPSGDWRTFTFDSPNMESHYRALDIYQRLGAVVNVTGVEWGMPDPYANPPETAKAIGALFEHLIRGKGYTCVQEWTLTNEPNGAFASHMGYTFDRFVQLHTLVKQQFAERGLSVRIAGSDDTGGLPWFTDCVRNDEYFNAADYLVSHRYLQYPDRILAPFFFEDRLSLLAAREPSKQFAVAEFGFQDARSGTLENPIMETYPYAVWTTAFIIQGLDRGVAGFSIWCLHEVYYPGNGFMNYGLWDFKDNAWKPRPVYHAMANFTRLTERGDKVLKCTSSHPDSVLAVRVNDTLFWVNQTESPAEVTIAGFTPSEVRTHTESTLNGDRECGQVVPLTEPRFTAPPQSFGYAR